MTVPPAGFGFFLRGLPCFLRKASAGPVLGVLVGFVLAEPAGGADATQARSGASPSGKTVRLLTVGNSFSGNATRYLGNLAQSAGHVLLREGAEAGGASLELHWSRAEIHEKDPSNPAGLYGKRSLKQALTAQPWDFITLQQASIKSHDPATYQPFARNLYGYIKEHAPKAEVLVHQTWAYRKDDPRFSNTPPAPGEPATQAEMYSMLSTAYKGLAAELGTRRLPVGDAFYLADTDPQWGYQPDPQAEAIGQDPAALPAQPHSLHVGWLRLKQPDGSLKRSMDGHHASVAGQYLAACVWFEVLFAESAVGNSYIAPNLDTAYARFLQETAHKAVEASQKEVPAAAR